MLNTANAAISKDLSVATIFLGHSLKFGLKKNTEILTKMLFLNSSEKSVFGQVNTILRT